MKNFRVGEDGDLKAEANKEVELTGSYYEGGEAFKLLMPINCVFSLRDFLDTWLFREHGGKVGHMAWELRKFMEAVSEGRDCPRATRLMQIIEESMDQAFEEEVPVEDVAIELSLLLATFLEAWVLRIRLQSSLQ